MTYQHSLYFPVEKLLVTLLITGFLLWKKKGVTAIHNSYRGFPVFFNNYIYS